MIKIYRGDKNMEKKIEENKIMNDPNLFKIDSELFKKTLGGCLINQIQIFWVLKSLSQAIYIKSISEEILKFAHRNYPVSYWYDEDSHSNSNFDKWASQD
jgi:hypothetical protein